MIWLTDFPACISISELQLRILGLTQYVVLQWSLTELYTPLQLDRGSSSGATARVHLLTSAVLLYSSLHNILCMITSNGGLQWDGSVKTVTHQNCTINLIYYTINLTLQWYALQLLRIYHGLACGPTRSILGLSYGMLNLIDIYACYTINFCLHLDHCHFFS